MSLPLHRPGSWTVAKAAVALLLVIAFLLPVGPVGPAPARADVVPGLPAPELDGGVGWINTTKPLHLRDLRGKFVVLDFWTLC